MSPRDSRGLTPTPAATVGAMWDGIRWLHLLGMAFFVGGQLMLAATVVLLLLAVAAARGSRRAWVRIRVISVVGVIAVAVIVSIPGFLPPWVDLEQGVCGALLLPVTPCAPCIRSREVVFLLHRVVDTRCVLMRWLECSPRSGFGFGFGFLCSRLYECRSSYYIHALFSSALLFYYHLEVSALRTGPRAARPSYFCSRGASFTIHLQGKDVLVQAFEKGD